MTLIRLEVEVPMERTAALVWARKLGERLASENVSTVSVKALRAKPTVELGEPSPLADLGLPGWINRLLDSGGIRSIGQLCSLSPAELDRLPGVGRRVIQTIEDALSSHDLSLQS